MVKSFSFKKLFKKKKKKESNKDDMSEINSSTCRIVIVSNVEDTPFEENSFLAQIIIDNLDGVRYMVNEEIGFKELYPETNDIFNFHIPGKTTQEQIQFLNKKIMELKHKLKENTKSNEKNLEFKIDVYEKKLKLLKIGIEKTTGSPVYIGGGGMKTFYFSREAGELVPLRWHMKGKSIYKDITYKKKQSLVAIQNMMQKFGNKMSKSLESSLIWGYVIVLIWTGLLLVGSYGLYSKYNAFDKLYDQAHINQLKTKAENSLLFCSDVLGKNVQIVSQLNNMSADMINLQKQFIVWNTQTRQSNEQNQTKHLK